MGELGVPYVSGGKSPEIGFDCSGLVQWAYAQVGVSIPRVTLEQVRIGTPASITELQPGDLIFTRGDVPVVDFGHVAMYVGSGIEINAPHTGAVVSLRAVDPEAVQAIRRVA
jgi:cell wall-associated NlpC family hydrolase